MEAALIDPDLQIPFIENVISPSIRDPPAELSMRMTQSLSSETISALSPTFQKFALKDKVAIVTG
jgi:hypothetical protein